MCNRCIDLPDSIHKLEQHAAVMKLPQTGRNKSKSPDGTTPRVSIFSPLQTEPESVRADPPRSLDAVKQQPQWMSLLPSNRNPHIQPPRHSALRRQSESPHLNSTRYSTPFSTPPENPTMQDQNGKPLPTPMSLCLSKSLPTTLSRRCPGEWPSSQSFIGSVSGSEVTIEGAVIPANSISDQPLQPLKGTRLSTANIMPSEKVTPKIDGPEQEQSKHSSSIPSVINSAKMPLVKLRRSDLHNFHGRSFHQTKTRNFSMADCMPEVPDAARHKPAYFKELSDFFATQDEKLALPSRALDRHQNLGKGLEYQQPWRRLAPTLAAEPERGSRRRVGLERKQEDERSERLDAAAAKGGAAYSAGHGAVSLPCKACRECPCRNSATKGSRKRLFRHAG